MLRALRNKTKKEDEKQDEDEMRWVKKGKRIMCLFKQDASKQQRNKLIKVSFTTTTTKMTNIFDYLYAGNE